MSEPTTYYVQLVGVSFRPAEAKEIVDQLEVGDTLTLVREPTNKYDKWAIQVVAGETDKVVGAHVGYVQRDMAEIIAPYMDQGWKFTATVQDKLAPRKPLLKIEPQYAQSAA